MPSWVSFLSWPDEELNMTWESLSFILVLSIYLHMMGS